MKKVLSILLALVLAVGLTACANGKQPEKATKATEMKYTQDAAYSMDSGVISAYESLCKAVVGGEDSVRLNLGLSENVSRLFYTSFPLHPLVDKLEPNEEKSGYNITYVNQKEEHLEKVAAFAEKVNAILKECADANPTACAVKLYHYVASSAQEGESTLAYDTLMNGSGNSFGYAQLLTYLLLQEGIPACYVTAKDADKAAWGLVQAKLGNDWFYLDPMTEFYDNKGEQLRFFGMTYKDIKAEGLTGAIYSDNNAARDASSLTFAACRYCKLYRLEPSRLVITTTDGDIVQIDL